MAFVDLTRDLHDLARMVGTRSNDEVLAYALDALHGLVPYDLAAVLRLRGDGLVVEAMAGRLAGAKVRGHTLDLAHFPTVRRAIETRRPIALETHHHTSDEGDPYDGVLDLPHGHGCMVVPMFAAGEDLGVITLDREVCAAYPPAQVELAGVVGQLVALSIRFAEQAALLDRYRHRLREHARLLVADAGGEAAGRRLELSASPAMQAVARLARQVAASDLPVLVLGETGTGKEVVAQALHTWSPRADLPFVKLNCASIPESLVESELFGHVRGAFSGADTDRAGRFLTANGGTLLLDEIGELPLSAQAKLLRVLQEGTFEAVGSDRTVKVDVRVLAATHVDLVQAVAAGKFRRDLYYRLAVFPLQLPPLRERPEEIGPIAQLWLAGEAARTRRGPWSLPEASLDALRAAPWPGNVRELINALERATILVPAGPLSASDLGLGGARAPVVVRDEPLGTWEAHERAYLAAVLSRADGRLYGRGGAAELAGLAPTTLRAKLVRFGLRA